MSASVWIVTAGEAYEGSSVQRVFATLALAVAYCEKYVAKDSRPWEKLSAQNWRRGCDYLEIEEWEVERE
jgi:hypothetical protein